MKYALTLDQIIELNNIIKDKGYNYKVHLHDTCGGQSFSLEKLEQGEEKYDDVYVVIEEYVRHIGLNVAFYKQSNSFVVM